MRDGLARLTKGVSRGLREAGLFLLLLLAAPVQAATAGLETASLGPLRDVVSLEPHGAWTAEVADGFYVLANRTEASSIRFFYLGPRYPGARSVAVGHRAIAVRVRVEAENGDNLGGLLYGYRPDPLFYYAFGLDGGGRAVLYRRDADGIATVLTATPPAGPMREGLVSVEEHGKEIVLRVDGAEVGRLTAEGTGEGGTGIVAIGRGRFGFRQFALRTASETVADEAGNTAPGEPPAPTSSPPRTPAPAPRPQPPAPETPPKPPAPSLAEAFGPLAPVVREGGNDYWKYGPEGGAFVLRNTTDATRFLQLVAPTPEIEGRRLIRTTLSVEADSGTKGAGLSYADTGDTAFFVLWMPDRRVVLQQVVGGRAVPLRAWKVEAEKSTSHRLWLAEDGDIIAIGFDHDPLGFVQNPAFGKGKVGIVAFGTGTFRFTEFEAKPLTEHATPLPVAAPPQAPEPTPPQQPPQPVPPGQQPGPWQQPPGPYGQQAPQQPGPWRQPPSGPYGQQPPQQPGPWQQPPGPYGQQPPQRPPQQPGPYGRQPPQQPGPWQQPPGPGPYGQQPPQQPGPWQQPPPPGPYGQQPPPQRPGPWQQPPGPYGQQPPQQPGPWRQPPSGPYGQQPPAPGPYGQQQPPRQPGPWQQPPGPYGQQPPQQPGPWGQQAPQPGPWGQQQGQPVPQAPRAPFDQKAVDGAIGDIFRLGRTLPDIMVETKPRPAPSPPKGWKRYTDPAVAIVSVNYPVGWEVRAIAQRSGYGALPAYADVRVTSPDGLHRMVARSVFAAQQQAADPVEVMQEVLDELAGDEAGQELLRDEAFASNTTTPGLPPAEGAFRAVRSGDYIVVAYAATLNMPAAGAFSTVVRVRAVAGPADRFAEMTAQVYLPLLNSTIAW